MSKKPTQPVTVTVRPDGSYYVEKERPAAQTQAAPIEVRRASTAARQPLAASLKSTLLEAGSLAAAVKAVAPALGPYGTLAALGFGLLRSMATPEPPPRPLRRIRPPAGYTRTK